VSEPDKAVSEGAPHPPAPPPEPTHRPAQAPAAGWRDLVPWAALVVAIAAAAWTGSRLGSHESEAARRLQAGEQRVAHLEAALEQAQAQLRDSQNRTAVLESKVLEAAGQHPNSRSCTAPASDSTDVLLRSPIRARAGHQQLALGSNRRRRTARSRSSNRGCVARTTRHSAAAPVLQRDIDRLKAFPAADIVSPRCATTGCSDRSTSSRCWPPCAHRHMRRPKRRPWTDRAARRAEHSFACAGSIPPTRRCSRPSMPTSFGITCGCCCSPHGSRCDAQRHAVAQRPQTRQRWLHDTTSTANAGWPAQRRTAPDARHAHRARAADAGREPGRGAPGTRRARSRRLTPPGRRRCGGQLEHADRLGRRLPGEADALQQRQRGRPLATYRIDFGNLAELVLVSVLDYPQLGHDVERAEPAGAGCANTASGGVARARWPPARQPAGAVLKAVSDAPIGWRNRLSRTGRWPRRFAGVRALSAPDRETERPRSLARIGGLGTRGSHRAAETEAERGRGLPASDAVNAIETLQAGVPRHSSAAHCLAARTSMLALGGGDPRLAQIEKAARCIRRRFAGQKIRAYRAADRRAPRRFRLGAGLAASIAPPISASPRSPRRPRRRSRRRAPEQASGSSNSPRDALSTRHWCRCTRNSTRFPHASGSQRRGLAQPVRLRAGAAQGARAPCAAQELWGKPRNSCCSRAHGCRSARRAAAGAAL